MLGDAEMTVVDAVETGKTECRGPFLALDVRQGEGSSPAVALPPGAFFFGSSCCKWATELRECRNVRARLSEKEAA